VSPLAYAMKPLYYYFLGRDIYYIFFLKKKVLGGDSNVLLPHLQQEISRGKIGTLAPTARAQEI
jgi:hypothetical protein